MDSLNINKGCTDWNNFDWLQALVNTIFGQRNVRNFNCSWATTVLPSRICYQGCVREF
jgi:hypothetical protein